MARPIPSVLFIALDPVQSFLFSTPRVITMSKRSTKEKTNVTSKAKKKNTGTGRKKTPVEPTSPVANEEQGLQSDVDGRHATIAYAAYFRAEKRGFASGSELDDWLEAEHELEHRPVG